ASLSWQLAKRLRQQLRRLRGGGYWGWVGNKVLKKRERDDQAVEPIPAASEDGARLHLGRRSRGWRTSPSTSLKGASDQEIQPPPPKKETHTHTISDQWQPSLFLKASRGEAPTTFEGNFCSTGKKIWFSSLGKKIWVRPIKEGGREGKKEGRRRERRRGREERLGRERKREGGRKDGGRERKGRRKERKRREGGERKEGRKDGGRERKREGGRKGGRGRKERRRERKREGGRKEGRGRKERRRE
ncbi:Transcription termination factor Rho, partial [Ophiophagus hannah]